MKYVCISRCQIRIGSKINLIDPGKVIELDKPHKCFRALPGEPEAPVDVAIDFATASKDELKHAKWKFKDAAAFVDEEYGVTLEQEEGDKKADVIRRILDARYRSVNASSFDRVSVE